MWPIAAPTQQFAGIRRIGVLMASADSDPEANAEVKMFRDALQKLGWIDGNNVRIVYRCAGAPKRLRGYAAELVEMQCEVIFAGSASALAALQQASRATPIVFARVSDPVSNGFVTSVARPSGNITGFATALTAAWTAWGCGGRSQTKVPKDRLSKRFSC